MEDEEVHQLLITAVRKGDVEEVLRHILSSKEAVTVVADEEKEERERERQRRSLRLVNGFDNMSSTPLMHAASVGHVEVARVLLQHGATARDDERLYVDEATIVQSGDHCRKDGTDLGNPLAIAAMNGEVELAELLLAHGAQPNTTHNNCFGRTPLHIAALYGLPDVVAMLLQYGVDPAA